MDLQHLELNKINSVTVSLTILGTIILIKVFDTSTDDLIFKISTLSGIIGLFWFFYEKYLWRISIFRLGGWLCSTPDLNGRWLGSVDREGDEPPHVFIMEIHQTMSNLKYYTYSKSSHGYSETVKLLKEDIDDRYVMASYWTTTTNNVRNKMKNDTFNGASRAIITFSEDEKILQDIYFTNRKPHTRGKLELIWEGKKRYGKFINV